MSRYCSIAILLLAFGLRVYHLDFQASLSDDALGLMLARHNPFSLFALTSTEPFPPTFYVTLSLWTKLAGDSEYGGRFFSLLFSLGSVSLMLTMGRRLLGEKGAVLAAFLLAIDPFEIFFGQEVRMYSMLLFFSLASSVMAYDLMFGRANMLRPVLKGTAVPPLAKRFTVYALVSAIAVMTHAFALFTLLAQNVCALVGAPRAWRWRRAWAISQVIVLAIFGLWVMLVASKLGKYTNALVSAPPLPSMLWRAISAYALGFLPANSISSVLPPVVALLSAIGLLWLALAAPAPTVAHSRSPFFEIQGAEEDGLGSSQAIPGLFEHPAFLFLLCWLLVPFFTVWIISLFKPLFYERYMVIALPPFLLLAAAGILALEAQSRGPGRVKPPASARWRNAAGQALAALALLLIAVPTTSQLKRYYETPVYARASDMRALASFLASVNNPVAITNVAKGDPLYGYYLPPAMSVASTLDMSNIDADLATLTAQHPTIWFLPFGNSDRQKQAFDWLTSHAYPAGSRWFGNAQALGFGATSAQRSNLLQNPLVWGGRMRLQTAMAPTSVPAGDPVDVTLSWQALGSTDKNDSVYIHLLDASGSTKAQHDGWPAGGARPTSSWQPGETIADNHGLLTETDLPADQYRLEVGVYDAAGVRLKLSDGRDSAIVGTVQITSPAPAQQPGSR